MKKTYLVIVFLIGISSVTFGQDLNSYKYVEVPEKFDFLKESNEYQLNELTKFLFEKYGFMAFMENEERPSNLSKQDCNILYADVVENSGLFRTNLQISLKDCRNNEVFLSEEGSSRDKDYKKAYYEALRNAFKYIEAINYTYSENKEKQAAAISIQNTPKPLVEKVVEEVVVSAIPQELPMKTEAVQPVSSKSKKKVVFTSGDLEFYLKQTKFGFQLFQSQMEEPFAKLTKTTSEEHFIYSTISSNGIAFFDISGNLNVEVMAKDGNSTTVKTYKLKN